MERKSFYLINFTVDNLDIILKNLKIMTYLEKKEVDKLYQLKVSRCSILNEYFADQFEKYLGATEASRQKTPGNEQQLDLRIEREEAEMV